jgi:hypothetical protein
MAFGALIVMIVSPVSAAEIRRRLAQGYRETLAEARKASIERRAELEAELARRQKRLADRVDDVRRA